MAAKSRKTKPALPLPALRVGPDDWAAYTAEPMAVAALVPYARNARTHSPRQVREIAGLIAKFGWTAPVLVDEAGGIIAGHGRVMAANLLGIAEVPVITARGWSDADKRAYIIADNKVAENAGWDKELLALELAALANMPEIGPLASLGFTDAELTRLMPEVAREGHADPDADAERHASAAVVSRPGDIWLLGDHRLMCGSSTNADHVAALLGTNRPHLMVTDPPYGVDYDPDWRNRPEELGGDFGDFGDFGGRAVGEVANDGQVDWRAAWALFPGEVAYVWHAAWSTGEVQASLESEGFDMRAQIIWGKSRFVISRGHYHWQHEPCWYAVRKGGTGHWQGSRSETTLWDIEHLKSETGHGTQKPIECMLRPMQNNSKPGDYVYEPFNGSGTSIIAGEMLGRRVLAMELMPKYVDVAVKRWEGFTKKSAILAAGERAWGEVAAQRLAEAQAA
jgi:DNA modification methylase